MELNLGPLPIIPPLPHVWPYCPGNPVFKCGTFYLLHNNDNIWFGADIIDWILKHDAVLDVEDGRSGTLASQWA